MTSTKNGNFIEAKQGNQTSDLVEDLLFTLHNSLQLQHLCKYLFTGQERTGLNKNLQKFQQDKGLKSLNHGLK